MGRIAIIDDDIVFTKMFKLKLEAHFKEIKGFMDNHFWCFYKNESNVRCEIIDPILAILGWRLPFLCREKTTIKDRAKRADYALIRENKIQVIIEAKEIKDKEITEKDEYYKQLCEYCKDNNMEYGILTNGIHWDFICMNEETHTLLGTINILDETEIERNIDLFISLLAFGNTENMASLIEKKKNEFSKNDKIDNDSKKNLIVSLGNETNKIEGNNPTDVLYNTIEKIGVQKVFDLEQKVGLRYVVVTEKEKRKKPKQRACKESFNKGFHITQDYSTATKMALLSEINDRLDLGMEITIGSN